MKILKTKLLVALALTLKIACVNAQVLDSKLIKQVSITHNGYSDTVDLAPILVNINGDVVVSGNQKQTATQYNMTTAAQISSGIIAWSQQYNTSTNKAWTTASTSDASGNLYIVGAIRSGTATGLDYLIIKYNASGVQQWVQTYNGPNSTTDVASAVCVDGSGNVYVTGASDGTLTALTDYATIKYNSSGVQQWLVRYNYANSIDVPTSISTSGFASTQEITVSGSSGSSLTSYDFATIKYKATNGSVKSTARTTNTNAAAQDQTYSMASDFQGNVYVLGTTKNGSNYDVQLVKLDTALNTIWTRTFDGHGLDDAGINVALDSSANVYVTGSSHVSATETELLVLKYNSAGTRKWKIQRRSQNGSPNGEGVRIKVKSKNEIFVGGNYGNNGGQDMVLLALDSLGHLKCEKPFNGYGNLKDKFMDMVIADSNFIYVSGRTYHAGVDSNIVIKYQYRNISQPTATITGGTKYVGNEIIVKFAKKALRLDTINNKEFKFGQLSDFVHDSTVTKLSTRFSTGGGAINAGNFETRKIFFDLTTSDTLSQSRTGNYVKVPDFYTELLITLPPSLNPISTQTALATIHPDIYWSEANFIFEPASTKEANAILSANDPYYALQGSLHTVPGFTNVNVNCDSAWTITTGEPNIKVGIFDTGVDFGHPDFPTNTSGFDFFNNVPTINYDDDNHGTAVAGIIGAARNNNLGISGMAGGDASSNKQGVNLVDCRVVNNQTCPTNVFKNAVLKGAQAYPIGLGLHVMNMSIDLGGSYINTVTPAAHVIVDQMNFANRSGVAMVAAKANLNLGTYTFPADFSDETTMSVGSSGIDGHHAVFGVNASNDSRTWGNIDFLAPGTDSLVKSLSNDGNGDIERYDGTSMATPHVSGAVALLMSYVNTVTPTWDNLVHEDCENILQRTCTDLVSSTYNEGAGYDTVSGWGRINVTKALKKVNKNFYKIRHVDQTHFTTTYSRSSSLVHTGLMLSWPAYNSIAAGTYSTDVYSLTTTLNYVLPPNEQVIGAWPLYKESYGTKDTAEIIMDRPYYCEIISANATTAVLKTYYFQNMNFPTSYVPSDLSGCKSAFSLYTYDPNGTIGIKENHEDNINFSLYPNPNGGDFDVAFTAQDSKALLYKVYNVVGQLVKSGSYRSQYGKNSFKINMPDLTNGIYILNIFDNTGLIYKQKVIKQ